MFKAKANLVLFQGYKLSLTKKTYRLSYIYIFIEKFNENIELTSYMYFFVIEIQFWHNTMQMMREGDIIFVYILNINLFFYITINILT